MNTDPETLVKDVLAKLTKTQEGATRQEVKELRSFVNEVSTALPDLVEAIEKGAGAGLIADALRVLADRMQKPDAPVVNVAAPAVTVKPTINVPAPAAAAPAPIHNHIIAAAGVGAVFEVRVKGANGEPDRVMTITRLK